MELGYFPKINDPNNFNNSFVNCYNESTISDGYYLNNITNQYEPCYYTCKKCNSLGDKNNNNCIECDNISFFNYFFDHNCYPNCLNYYYIDYKSQFQCTPDKNCPDGYKLINSQRMCINNCLNDNIYNHYYEYNNICYNRCPNQTIFINNKCINETSYSEYEQELCPYILVDINKCEKDCYIEDLLNKKCKIGYINDKLKEKHLHELKKAIISHSIDLLLFNLTNGNHEDLLLDGKEIKYQITTSLNQINKVYNNISIINLGECEKRLKSIYNIRADESLLILKIDIYYEGILSPIVIYEAYHPRTKEKLDLIHCKDISINISLPIHINEKELYKHDPLNKFYNDICSTYTTEVGTDITLDDRQNEFINNNLSLCEFGCKFIDYDYRVKKVNCECLTKIELPIISEIKIDKEKLKNNFLHIKNIININIMKCYQKLLTKEGLISNEGSYILLSIMILFFVGSNLFILIEYDNFFNKIEEIFELKKKENNDNCNNNDNIEKINNIDNIEDMDINTIRNKIKIYEQKLNELEKNKNVKKVTKRKKKKNNTDNIRINDIIKEELI